VNVHPASVQDRDGAEALLRDARRSFPFLERIIGDAGYQGQKMQAAVTRTGTWELQVVAAATGTGPSCCQKDGSSCAPWHGSAAVDGWHATTSVTLARRPRSSASP
jgi:hypothetical protein